MDVANDWLALILGKNLFFLSLVVASTYTLSRMASRNLLFYNAVI